VPGLVGEDPIIGPDRVAVSLLPPAPRAEHSFGVGVQVDAASARAGLDCDFDRAAGDDLPAPGDGKPLGRLVLVAPAESRELAASHAGERREVQRGMQPQVPCWRGTG
jgi:hypothetical protein